MKQTALKKKKSPSDAELKETELISDALSEAAKDFHAQEHFHDDARLAEEEIRAEAQAERQDAEELLKAQSEAEEVSKAA
jgi:hypothetical protein